jgi:hypothetical protein
MVKHFWHFRFEYSVNIVQWIQMKWVYDVLLLFTSFLSVHKWFGLTHDWTVYQLLSYPLQLWQKQETMLEEVQALQARDREE